MLVLTVTRPNIIGQIVRKEYDSYSDVENYIERRCESLADQGWELSELSGSTSERCTIECTHDNEADILLIEWYTVKE